MAGDVLGILSEEIRMLPTIRARAAQDILSTERAHVVLKTTSLVPDGAKPTLHELCDDPRAFTKPLMVRGVMRDAAFGMQRRVWREQVESHNLQLNVGRDQIKRIAQYGDFGTALHALSATGTATTPTATTWTGAGGSFPTGTSGAGNAGLQGKWAFIANALSSSAFTNPVIGVILSNTATVLTVDHWYAVPITGAAGTTPSANSACLILPGAAAAYWVALSTSVSAAAAGDVTRTADGLWGDGTGSGTATEQNTNGLSRAYVGSGGTTEPSISGANNYTFAHTWTYTGASTVTIGKVILFNSDAGAGTIPLLETLLSANASVASNGDTIVLSSWSITVN